MPADAQSVGGDDCGAHDAPRRAADPQPARRVGRALAQVNRLGIRGHADVLMPQQRRLRADPLALPHARCRHVADERSIRRRKVPAAVEVDLTRGVVRLQRRLIIREVLRNHNEDDVVRARRFSDVGARQHRLKGQADEARLRDLRQA